MQNIVKKDPGRAKQKSGGTAGRDFTKSRTCHFSGSVFTNVISIDASWILCLTLFLSLYLPKLHEKGPALFGNASNFKLFCLNLKEVPIRIRFQLQLTSLSLLTRAETGSRLISFREPKTAGPLARREGDQSVAIHPSLPNQPCIDASSDVLYRTYAVTALAVEVFMPGRGRGRAGDAFSLHQSPFLTR